MCFSLPVHLNIFLKHYLKHYFFGISWRGKTDHKTCSVPTIRWEPFYEANSSSPHPFNHCYQHTFVPVYSSEYKNLCIHRENAEEPWTCSFPHCMYQWYMARFFLLVLVSVLTGMQNPEDWKTTEAHTSQVPSWGYGFQPFVFLQ